MAFLLSLFSLFFYYIFLAICLIPKYVERYVHFFHQSFRFCFLYLDIGASVEHLPLVQYRKTLV